MRSESMRNAALRAGDLVPDHALTEADRDEFGHSEIAARVADLVTTADPPINVALFGPWGSGKSSFATLLQTALKGRTMKTAFVHYDAWKYSGEALQRSFIAEAADQLGVDDPYYSSQLAQTVERTQLDLKQVTWKQAGAYLRWVWRLVVPVMFGGLLLIAAIIAVTAAAAGENVGHELLRFAALFAIPVGLGVASAVAKLIADTVTTREIEAPPSDERFEERFKSLLKTAANEGGYKRFIFFIDELDRVSRRDVVATLGVIRNFLDQKNAAFVVAADKQVLEQAFAALPQATPTNEETPYYSSASEFLDKIFQHQVALPPLRGQSLYRYAYDLVVNRFGGVWADLKAAEPDAALLNGVLYALIPSHVRSPRRVKVLLNNFATNARIAQSRGVDWLERARELAKLTVLQTEFPLLAADLPVEPRLPRFVLSTEGAVISDRTRHLLERHGIATPPLGEPEEEEADDEDDEEDEAPETDTSAADELVGATDTLLVPKNEQRKLIGVQRENLRRYLIRVQKIRDPSGELLYLQAGGADEGLDDPALGDLIESEARDDPTAVVAAVRERNKEEQQAAVRVLAGMAEQEYSLERTNVVSALLGIVDLLDGDVGPSLQSAADALSQYARTDTFETGQLVGALRLGIAVAASNGDDGLRDQVLADDRLLADAPRVWTVGKLLDALPDGPQERVRNAIARFLPETTDVLSEPLLVVSPAQAERLLRHPKVKAVAQEFIDDPEPGEEAEKLPRFWFRVLNDRADPAPLARIRLMRLLLDAESRDAYTVAVEEAPAVLEASGTSPAANGVALSALRKAEAADWGVWLPWLDVSKEAAPQHKQMAQAALASIFTELAEADEDELGVALELVPKVVQVGRLRNEDADAALTAAVQGALQAGAWWTSDERLLIQEKVHEVVRALGNAVGETTTESFSELRYQDVNRGLASAAVTPITCRGVTGLAVELDAASLGSLATRLASTPLTGAEEADTELVDARIHLVRAAALVGETAEEAPYEVAVQQVVAVGRYDSPRAHAVVAAWFETEPGASAAEEVITQLSRSPAAEEAEAFRLWIDRLPDSEARTQFLLALLPQGQPAYGWLRAASSAASDTYSEQVIAHAIADAGMRASRAEDRGLAAAAFAALAPRTPDGQREVANFVIWLLERERKADYEIALEIVPSLGSQHGMGRRIGRAFRKAGETLGRKIPARYKAAFEDTEIVLGKDYFARPPKKGRLSRLIGR